MMVLAIHVTLQMIVVALVVPSEVSVMRTCSMKSIIQSDTRMITNCDPLCNNAQAHRCCTRRNTILAMANSREDEIRRKILELKKSGKLKKTDNLIKEEEGDDSNLSPLEKLKRDRERKGSITDRYADRLQKKLGAKKAKMMGIQSTAIDGDDADSMDDDINDYDDDDDDDISEDLDEKTLVDLVQEKLMEKTRREMSMKNTASLTTSTMSQSSQGSEYQSEASTSTTTLDESTTGTTTDTTFSKTTTGVGGAWNKNDTAKGETYRPANGGWGVFERPKDISKAFGGGKKIEVRSTMEDERRREKEIEATRERLRRYRQNVGIDVQSEKDNAQEIEDALVLGQKAMQRGVYSTAVSALEKVTPYCSTNSKVGGKVFLELAMAYEAVGRTSEAITVYSTLSNSLIEETKITAKRLLSGIEAITFMRDEAKVESFQRKKSSQTFIDTTGLANIADNFDKKYNTAYIDLDQRGGFFKKLSENVVRSIREARQILLMATDAGEVDRMKVVQALRSVNRNFDEAARKEEKKKQPKLESVAVMNGKPIIRIEKEESLSDSIDTYNLPNIDEMREIIDGEWRLQLMADKKGDGVNYFNKTLSWQYFDTADMSFESSGPAGFLTLSQTGIFQVNDDRSIARSDVRSEGSGALLSDLFGKSGAVAATNTDQQIISVDSELLITRLVVKKKVSTIDNVKDYFSVWRRVKSGTYSSK